MEMVLIKENSPEWEYMWEWLSSHPINKELESPSVALNEGEAWQYMGSFRLGNRVIHELRHRLHPLTNATENLKLSASENISDEDIEKVIPVK